MKAHYFNQQIMVTVMTKRKHIPSPDDFVALENAVLIANKIGNNDLDAQLDVAEAFITAARVMLDRGHISKAITTLRTAVSEIDSLANPKRSLEVLRHALTLADDIMDSGDVKTQKGNGTASHHPFRHCPAFVCARREKRPHLVETLQKAGKNARVLRR